MGAGGGSSPQPWSQYEAKTLFLRVPSIDWAAVKIGTKTEFRVAGRASLAQNVYTPTPVVAYTVRASQHDSKLMVLTAVWREPLGAITRESLAAEGFPDFAHFRRYWMARTHRRFTPLTSVLVYTLRQWTDSDATELGTIMLRRLYRDHL